MRPSSQQKAQPVSPQTANRSAAAPASSAKGPQTGDVNPPLLWFAFMALSAACFGTVAFTRRKRSGR